METSDRIAAGEPANDAIANGPRDPSARARPQSPDHDAFLRWLHAEYAGRLLALVQRFTDGDRHWAEDVVQETLLRAWRHADLLMDGQARSLMPWLATVARRIAINDRRSRASRPREVGAEMLEVMSVQDETERSVLRTMITDALDQLTPAHRTVIIEAVVRGRPLDEVAHAVGVPVGTVKSRVHYALRALRAALPPDD